MSDADVPSNAEAAVIPQGFRYVGCGQRALAALVDTLAIAVVLTPIAWLLGSRASASNNVDWQQLLNGDPEALQRLLDQQQQTLGQISSTDLLLNVVLPMALVLLCWFWISATPGKLLFQARIVDARTGGRPGRGQLVLRYLGYFVSTIPFGLGLLWIAVDPRKKGWHDKLAGTLVVAPAGDAPADVTFPA